MALVRQTVRSDIPDRAGMLPTGDDCQPAGSMRCDDCQHRVRATLVSPTSVLLPPCPTSIRPLPCPNGHSLGVCHIGVGVAPIVGIVLLLRKGEWGKVRLRERPLTFAPLCAFLLPAGCLRLAMGDGGGLGARVGVPTRVARLAWKAGDITHSN